jgi:BMFP domain-containing protein YqiC
MGIQNRETYATKVRTDLNELSTRLSILEAAAKQKSGASHFDYESHISEFRQRRDDLEKRIESLEDGASDNWETNRTEIEAAIEDLREDLATAMDEAGLTSEREKERGEQKQQEVE